MEPAQLITRLAGTAVNLCFYDTPKLVCRRKWADSICRQFGYEVPNKNTPCRPCMLSIPVSYHSTIVILCNASAEPILAGAAVCRASQMVDDGPKTGWGLAASLGPVPVASRSMHRRPSPCTDYSHACTMVWYCTMVIGLPLPCTVPVF